MDQLPAAQDTVVASHTDTIEEETGEGLLLNDPLVMSMYQSSPTKNQTPDSSPDSSPVRPLAPNQLAEDSLSDKEFEQMEAAALSSASPVHALITQTTDFSDFGHANLMDDEYLINKDDPFQTPAKAGTKSSDEDEYELIPQSAAAPEADVSNLMSLSPERSFAADTTIIDADTSAGRLSLSPVMQAETADSAESFPPAPSPPVQQAAAAASVAVSSQMTSAADAAVIDSESDDGDDIVHHVLSAPPETRIADSQPEPHPVSPVPLLTAIPKKTETSDQIRTAKQEYPSPDSQRNTVSMASADSSTSGCPFTTVADLVFWKDPRKSGIAFGTGLLILLSLACCSVISVVAYTGLTVLTGTLSFRVYKNILQAVQKTNEGHPFREYLEVEVTPSNERVHQMVDVVLKHVNAVLRKLRSVFLVEDIIDSLKFVVLFWCLTYIGAWFNGLTLVILTYLSAFSLPIVYEMHKTQIDQAVGQVYGQIQDVITTVKSKIPFPAAKDKKQE